MTDINQYIAMLIKNIEAPVHSLSKLRLTLYCSSSKLFNAFLFVLMVILVLISLKKVVGDFNVFFVSTYLYVKTPDVS